MLHYCRKHLVFLLDVLIVYHTLLRLTDSLYYYLLCSLSGDASEVLWPNLFLDDVTLAIEWIYFLCVFKRDLRKGILNLTNYGLGHVNMHFSRVAVDVGSCIAKHRITLRVIAPIR